MLYILTSQTKISNLLPYGKFFPLKVRLALPEIRVETTIFMLLLAKILIL